MELAIKFLAGKESKEFLVELTGLVERLEKVMAVGGSVTNNVTNIGGTKKKAAKAEPEEEEEELESEAAEETEEEEEDFAPKKKSAKKAKAAAFEEEEESEEAEETEEEEDFTAPAKKTKGLKAKKITLDEVNDACKAKALSFGNGGVAKVRALLKKTFKSESVTALKPEQYAECVALMEV